MSVAICSTITSNYYYFFLFIPSEFNRDKLILYFMLLRKHYNYITILIFSGEESPNSIGFVIQFYCFINLGSTVNIGLLMAALNAAKDSGEVSTLKSVSSKFSCQ